MKQIKNLTAYRHAQIFHLSKHDVIANLFLRAAYGVKNGN